VKEEYFDAEIERQVERMQVVIELTRNVREKHNVSLKTPLKELLVFHADEGFLDDIRPLQRYIQSELNIRHVLFTSDEALSGVRYRAVADWSVLGKKLRGNLARVKNALPTISSNEIKEYGRTGQITVDGIQLVEGDLAAQRYIELPPASEGLFATNSDTDSNVAIKLDLQIHAELAGEWLAREFINRVQKLRKKAGLQATDNVHVFYRFENSTGQDIQDAITEYKDMIERTVGSTPTNAVDRTPGAQLVIEEEQVVADTKFLLYLVRP